MPDSAGYQPVERLTQQSLTTSLSEWKAMRACIPTCFYMLASAAGLADDLTLLEFVAGLGWDTDRTDNDGWNRARLSHSLRAIYGWNIINWGTQVVGHDDTDRLQASFFIETPREIEVFKTAVQGRTVAEIVAGGIPVVAGVVPGFGANQSSHGVVISAWSGDNVTVIDPDSRNDQTVYHGPDVVSQFNVRDGGFTIILPD